MPTFPENALGPTEPIPLTVLTGFLGAGKTSLLNRLVTDPALAETAVIINELGEIGLDHLLVKPISEGVVLLQSGCLCCTLRGDLVDALEQLLRDLDNGRAVFRRVILETTGLADPAPVLQTAMAHPYLVMRYRLDGVITVVDAINADATLDAHMESVKQVAVADRLVLTKTDLLTPQQQPDNLIARLRALNPAAPILDAAAGEATPARLIACGLYDPERKSPDVKRWLAAEAYAASGRRHSGAPRSGEPGIHNHRLGDNDDPGVMDSGPRARARDRNDDGERGHHAHHHDVNRHDERIRAFAFESETAIPAPMLDMFLDLLRSVHGENLLRLKGIVKLRETPTRPVVIHGVQHIFHPVVQLPGWPDGDERTRIVLITRDLDPSAVQKLFNAFVGASAPDQPDRAAIIDNPLVPFGGIDR